MEQIHSLFYKDGEEWKPLAYGDIITITEPDEEKAPELEALELFMEEPVTFTVTLTKKATKKLRRIFAPSKKEEQRQRLRAAKRRNRQRRLRRWKDNTKTVPPCLQALRRQMARIRRTFDALEKALHPTINQIKDCVGRMPGVGFYKEKEAEDCESI